MHLTPEQIDRQPFRMTRRGYDIVEVRDFLREVATEMRERRDVRTRLASDGEETASGQAKAIVDDAEANAAAIVAEAEGKAESLLAEAQIEAERRIGSAETMLERADERAQKIREGAQVEADALIESAEERAIERSDVVLTEAQERLDEILLQEREFLAQIEAKSELSTAVLVGAGASDGSGTSHILPTSSLADLMKSTLRQELHTD